MKTEKKFGAFNNWSKTVTYYEYIFMKLYNPRQYQGEECHRFCKISLMFGLTERY